MLTNIKKEVKIMSDMKQRELKELLDKVDEFFREKGLLEAVNTFLDSDQVKSRVDAARNELLENMKEMEKNAANDKVMEAATMIRSQFEEDDKCIYEDVVATFKVNFSNCIRLFINFTDDAETVSMILEKTKESIPVSGIKDIDDICNAMVEKNSRTFMTSIYMNYVPEGIPEGVLAFIQLLCGGGPMNPITAIFPELFDDNQEDSNT